MKFGIGQEPTASASEYRMYVNELILGDNTIQAELDGTRITFLNYGVLFIVHTRDERFNNVMSENLENLIKKSMMISKSGEKERVRFFNQLRERIYEYRDKSETGRHRCVAVYFPTGIANVIPVTFLHAFLLVPTKVF